MKKIYFLAFSVLLTWSSLSAHDWTYRVTSSDSKDFFMWTPYVKNFRGIIFTTKPNYIASLLGDTAIRRVCQEEQIAIVSFQAGSIDPAVIWPLLQNGLKALALQSGHPEIEYAPICTQGHSTEGLAAIRLAAYQPSRFFGVIMQNAIINNDDINTLNTRIQNVPLLSTRGAEERRVSSVGDFPWSATKTGILWMRNSGEKATFTIQPGAGHFGWFPFASQYAAKWLKQASLAMIPSDTYATTAPVTLNTVNQSDGWLIECPDTLITTTLATLTPYSYQNYVSAGKDVKKALWFFNQEMAQYWINIHTAEEAKLPSTVRFSDASLNVNNAWASRINLNSYTQTVNLATVTTPASLPVRYTTAWNAVSINGSLLVSSACKYPIYGNNDWGVAVFDGNSQYRVSEQVQWVKTNSVNSTAAFTFTDISDKNANAAPFAFGATYSSNPTTAYIVSGAVKTNGSNLEIEPFYKGTSTAEICYCKDQYRSNPTDKFNITWVDGTWTIPGDYTTSVKSTENLNSAETFSYYPNPAKGNININYNSIYSTTATFRIYNTNGSLVRVISNEPVQIGDNTIRLNTNELNGLYFLSMQVGNKTISQKIIFEK